MKQQNHKQKLIKIIFGTIIALAIIISTIYSAVSVEVVPGTCTQYNYTAYDYATNYITNTSMDFCCNQTLINTTNAVYLNWTLSPGEHRTGNTDNCYSDLTCNSCNCPSTNAICSRNKTLEAGDTYEVRDSACDISFTCEEDETQKECDSQKVVEQQVSVKVEKTGNFLKVSALGQDKTYFSNVTSLSDEFQVSVYCPQNVVSETNTTANLEWTYYNCKEWVDALDSRNLLAFQYLGKYLQDGQESAFNFSNGVMAGQEQFRAELITCQSKLIDQSILQQQVSNVNNQNTAQTKEITDLKSDRIGLIWISSIAVCAFLICLFKGILQDGWFKSDEVTE